MYVKLFPSWYLGIVESWPIISQKILIILEAEFLKHIYLELKIIQKNLNDIYK